MAVDPFSLIRVQFDGKWIVFTIQNPLIHILRYNGRSSCNPASVSNVLLHMQESNQLNVFSFYLFIDLFTLTIRNIAFLKLHYVTFSLNQSSTSTTQSFQGIMLSNSIWSMPTNDKDVTSKRIPDKYQVKWQTKCVLI